MTVDLDDGGVNHGVFHIWRARDGVEDALPAIRFHQARKRVHAVIQLPKVEGRFAPRTARSRNPQHRLDEEPVVAAFTPAQTKQKRISRKWISKLLKGDFIHV